MAWLRRSENGKIVIARSWREIVFGIIILIVAICVIIVAFVERWSYIIDAASEGL